MVTVARLFTLPQSNVARARETDSQKSREGIVKRSLRWLLAIVVMLAATGAWPTYHTFQIEQIYSNADGTVQFVVLHESLGADGENLLAGHTLTITHSGNTK